MSIHTALQVGVRSVLVLSATPSMQYRTTPAGAWINFSAVGCVFHADATQTVQSDQDHAQTMMPQTAHLKVPYDGTDLQVLPVGKEWQVKDSSLNVWAVVGKSRHLGQTFYNLVRAVAVNRGHPNGTVS
jgi:hypothetical protein